MKKILIVLTLLCASTQAIASESSNLFFDGFMQTASWGKPLWAESHSTIIRTEIAYATNNPSYDFSDSGKDNRPFIFPSLSVDVPLWSNNFSDGKFGIGVNLPLISEVWLDLFDYSTAPVINASYRFGVPEVTFIHRLDGDTFFRNYTVRLVVHMHESTHLGDEISIKNAEAGFPIKRVNISYNYHELELTLNDPDGRVDENHTFKIGGLISDDTVDSWYGYSSIDATAKLLPDAKYFFEAYFQYQYQSDLFWDRWQFIFSTEFRLRPLYGYPYYYKDASGNIVTVNVEEKLTFNTNIYTGIRYIIPEESDLLFSKIGFALHYYNGMNQQGQFRNIDNYEQIGFAVIFE